MQNTRKNQKKLSFHREQIRTLSDTQLHDVIGGTDTEPTRTEPTRGSMASCYPPPKPRV